MRTLNFPHLLALCAISLLLPVSTGSAQERPNAGAASANQAIKVELKRDLSKAPDEPDWTNTDIHYQARRFSSFRTNPIGWSQEGGYGLRWGMGPGDVQKVIADVKFVFRLSDDFQQSIITQKVQGRDVTVFLKFYRGRLFEITLTLNSLVLVTGGVTHEELTRSWQQSWEWRETVRKILNDSNGPPTCAPSERTRTNFCDVNWRLCGDHKRREALLKWIWRSPESEIMISGTGNYKVTYRDLAMISIVEQAEGRTQMIAAMKKAQQDAAERQKLAGLNDPIPLPQAAEPEILADFAVPPLRCVTESEPSAEQRISESGWSKAGWERIRWGMGPGDVRAVLGVGKEFSWEVGNMYRDDTLFIRSGVEFFDGARPLSFSFREGRLQSFTVHLICDDSSTGKRECSVRQKKIYAQFDKQYGRAYCSEALSDIETCLWDMPQQTWISSTRLLSLMSESVAIRFDDPKDKAFRIKGPTAESSVPPSKWNTFGWNDFKWGMGVTDVVKRLSDKRGAFKASKDPLCTKKVDSERTSCSLGNGYHEFKVENVSPDIAFEFNDKSLQSISLKFGKGIPRSSFWPTAEKFRDLLVQRYGQADHRSVNDDRDARTFMLEWRGKQFKGGVRAHDSGIRPEIAIQYDDPTSPASSGSASERSGGL